jgi:hypothetical protein
MAIQYMHTIDGKPAYFAGDQIVFAPYRGKPAQLAPSRDAIKEQQRMTKAFRKKHGFDFNETRFSFIKVQTADA